MERVQELISKTHEFKYLHIFRAANCVADSISKHRHNLTSPQLYYNNQDLPKEAKAYCQPDLLDMPCFWRKKTEMIREPPLNVYNLLNIYMI